MRKLSMIELGRKTAEEAKQTSSASVCIVLDNVRSLANVGSIFRTCDAFAVSELFLCGITGTPPHRDIHKSALGAEESVSWRYFENTQRALAELKSKGYTLVAAEQTTESTLLHKFSFNADQKYALIFGNEVDGVADAVLPLLDAAVEIPQLGAKHSFNVAVSVGIILWDYSSKINAIKT